MTAPTPLPPQLQYKKLSRHWRLDVDSTALGSATAAYVHVKGKRNLTLGVGESVADTTDSESDGWTSEIVAMRSWEIVLEAQETGVIIDGVRTPDAGQEILRAKSLATGEDAQLRVRIQYGENGPGYTGYVNVKGGGVGGNAADGVENANYTLSSAGPLVPFAAPDETP